MKSIIKNKSKNIIIETLKILDDENILFIKDLYIKVCLPCKEFLKIFYRIIEDLFIILTIII